MSVTTSLTFFWRIQG